MFYTYVLRSNRNGKLYTGHTEDLKKRILEHNTINDKTKFSCVNRPWELMFFETYDTRAMAMRRERFLKTGSGRKYIKEKIKNDAREVAQLG